MKEKIYIIKTIYEFPEEFEEEPTTSWSIETVTEGDGFPYHELEFIKEYGKRESEGTYSIYRIVKVRNEEEEKTIREWIKNTSESKIIEISEEQLKEILHSFFPLEIIEKLLI